MFTAQCWSWGGELAFPLPKSDDFCGDFPSYVRNVEELWIAGPLDCGEARCPIPFDAKDFVEGTFDMSNDLCHVKTDIDANSNTLRRGYCALPVAMQPRTPLPADDTCPKQSPGK